MSNARTPLHAILDEALRAIDRAAEAEKASPAVQEYGEVISIAQEIARIRGLPHVQAEEVLRFSGGLMGIAFNLDPGEVGAFLLDPGSELQAGSEVRRTTHSMTVPVGEGLLGRVVDPLGRSLDHGGEVQAFTRVPIESEATPILDRAPVTVPLATGIKVIDALIPVGRGQRELILGDRQTGKTAIAVDCMLNQKNQNVLCIYCAIGQRSASVARVIADLRDRDALHYCIVVVASGDAPAGQQFVAPYAAMAMGEYFMRRGRDVLLILDDLSRHARAYRELSLLLRRPPGREGFPGDIFYVHSRLLERSTHLRPSLGGGSLTVLPVVETEEQNLAAYIPTNLISITDGQIYVTPTLFQKGILPAVDVGKSVSRVGGKTQLPAYRVVGGQLRLFYSQFEELEVFSRFGTRLDEHTRRMLARGQAVREVLKQPQYDPMSAAEQIAVLLAASSGVFDNLSSDEVVKASTKIREMLPLRQPEFAAAVAAGKELAASDRDALLALARNAAGTIGD